MRQALLYPTLLSKLLTVVGLLLFPLLTAAVPVCEKQQIRSSKDRSQIDLRIGDRKISILGWTHLDPSPSEEKETAALIQGAVNSATKSDCSSARQNLQKLWLNQYKYFQSSAQLLEDLKTMDSRIQPKVLAVEYSPELWPFRMQQVQRQVVAINTIATQCPQQTQDLIHNIALLYPGPEYQYMVSRNFSIAVEPIENEKVRATTVALIQEIRRNPLDSSALNAKANKLTEAISDRLRIGAPVTEEKIQEAVQAQGNNEIGRQLDKELHLLQKILANNPLRNQKMADKILAGYGNYVLPIGNTHVRDLAQQIYDRCLKGKGLNPIPTYGPMSPTRSPTYPGIMQ